MKDETCDVLITGFVGLKSKIYTFITEGNHESQKLNYLQLNISQLNIQHLRFFKDSKTSLQVTSIKSDTFSKFSRSSSL